MTKKYIDAEKIRSEVERIKEAGCGSPISVCNDILSFIDSLQQEQPEVDLEKEIEIKPIEKDGKVIGVEIPIIEKELLFEDISKEEMSWYEAMEYAKKKGKALLTKRELFILAYFMDDICKYYPDLRNMWIWSSTESSKSAAWGLYTDSNLYRYYKYYSARVVPCADLKN